MVDLRWGGGGGGFDSRHWRGERVKRSGKERKALEKEGKGNISWQDPEVEFQGGSLAVLPEKGRKIENEGEEGKMIG